MTPTLKREGLYKRDFVPLILLFELPLLQKKKKIVL
jgi:hypothetical protein|tara:strand:- start:196 stop:303 length:108 start_codon:yes stop_codon:yes gene_type:complete